MNITGRILTVLIFLLFYGLYFSELLHVDWCSRLETLYVHKV